MSGLLAFLAGGLLGYALIATLTGPPHVDITPPHAEYHTTIIGPEENQPIPQHRSTP